MSGQSDRQKSLAELTLLLETFFTGYGLVRKFSINDQVSQEFLESPSMKLRLQTEILAKFRKQNFIKFQFQPETFKRLLGRILSFHYPK